MRKALLIVVLIGASFAGGAVVNGPGLAWLRSQLQGQPLDPDEPPLDAIEVDMASSSEMEGIPAAPLPPLTQTPALGEPPAPIAEQVPLATAAPGEPAPAPKPSELLLARGPAADQPATTPAAAASGSPPPAAAPAESVLAPAEPPATAANKAETPQLSETTTPGALPALPGRTAVAGTWGDAPDSNAPAQAVVPGRPIQPDTHVDSSVTAALHETPAGATAPATGGGDPTSWVELRRRMQGLGVTRYWVEGEPDGAVRFRCLIPLAGGRAVGQHFEAEADDVLEAADAALRRIALWRATESQAR